MVEAYVDLCGLSMSKLSIPIGALLADGNGMRVPVRHQRKIDTRHINEQGRADEEDSYPETPVTVRPFPVGTMVLMNAAKVWPLFVMRMRALAHSLPAFSIRSPGFEPSLFRAGLEIRND